jgi:uncharacterized protein YjcR
MYDKHNERIDMAGKTMTPTELASELNISPKTLRGWLRKHHTRPVNVKNTSWALDAKTCASARKALARKA